jgi:hypothetical protein
MSQSPALAERWTHAATFSCSPSIRYTLALADPQPAGDLRGRDAPEALSPSHDTAGLYGDTDMAAIGSHKAC